jgi:hypothetical protein
VIDFRYHLVSIIAVFLALAVGLVVGATALAPATEALLKTAESELSKANASLSKDNRGLHDQVSGDQAFAQAVAPRLLPGLLAGRKVVVVSTSAADGPVVTGVTSALRQAGATVTGEVIVNPLFLLTDGHAEDQLTQLAQNLEATAGVTLPSLSSGSIPGQQAAARLLAASLLTGGGTSLDSTKSSDILRGLSQNQYVSIGSGASSVPAPASYAVLVAPGGTPPQTGSRVLVALAAALRNAGRGTVMVSGSESVGLNSVIDAEFKAGQVSTVDNADTEIGQIMTVQALKLLVDGKSPGHYGIAPDASPAAPSPAPTPSVTSASTASPSVSTSSGGHK